MNRRRTANRPESDGWQLSNQVRVWDIRVNESRKDQDNTKKRKKTYSVRWIVSVKEHQRTFATRALAEAERSKLIGFQQRGIAFDVRSGLPEPLLREAATRSWFDHMCLYIDNKWSRIAGNSRKSVADALTTVTPAMLSTDRGEPGQAEIRELVWNWVTVKPVRQAGPPADHLLPVLKWLEHNTIPLPALEEWQHGATRMTRALDRIATRLDGKPAAPNTVARRKAVLYNVLKFGVEQGFLSANPLDYLSWTAPQTVEAIDSRSVVNMVQGRKLLAAVRSQGPMGERLEAFFAAMLYAALRPAESLGLREPNLASMPTEGWGELLLSGSTPRSGKLWSDAGTSREDRGLKHRARNDTRQVPAHPELVAIIRRHVDQFGFGPAGRLFIGPRGGLIEESTYLPIWQRARAAVLTPAELDSPLARRPYDLRHTAVSTWLNAGVPATQVARWAGHSVAVLLKVYAKCVVGQDKSARDRVERALREAEQEEHERNEG